MVPFTYVTSFIFTNDNVAQTVTIFLHFAFAGIGAITTLILRMIETTFKIGDRLHWWLKIIPSFCLTNPIMYSSSKDRLFALRPELDKGDLDMSLIGGDMAVLAGHFGFWIIILILIEVGLFSWILKLPFLLRKNVIPLKYDIELDEDVIAEE